MYLVCVLDKMNVVIFIKLCVYIAVNSFGANGPVGDR